MISRSATDAPVAFGLALPPGDERTNLELARQYLAAIETSSSPDSAADPLRFFAPDVIQVEYPNQLVAHGATRDLDAIVQASERGRKVVRAQRYEVHSARKCGRISVSFLPSAMDESFASTTTTASSPF